MYNISTPQMVGLTLIVMRHAAKMTRSGFCLEYSYDTKTISRCENGLTDIRIMTIIKILDDVYGIKIEQFFKIYELLLTLCKDLIRVHASVITPDVGYKEDVLALPELKQVIELVKTLSIRPDILKRMQ